MNTNLFGFQGTTYADWHDAEHAYGIAGLRGGLGALGQCDPTEDPTCGTPTVPICAGYVTCSDGSVVCPSFGESCPPSSGGGGSTGSQPISCPTGYAPSSDGSVCVVSTGLGCDPTQASCSYQCDNGVWTSDLNLCPTSGGTGTGTGSGSGGGTGTQVGQGTPSNPASAASQVNALGSFFGSLLKSLTGTGSPTIVGYNSLGQPIYSTGAVGSPYGTSLLGTTSLTSNSTLLWILIIGGIILVAKR